MTGQGQVRVLADDDLAPLARFCAAWPGETESTAAWLARFSHWWTKNPYHSPSTPRGWVLVDG